DSARRYYRKAMELYRKQRNWEQLVKCNYRIAKVTFDFDLRLQYYNRALALSESHLGKEHNMTGVVLHILANHYRVFGDYDRALELSQRAFDSDLAIYGEVHHRVNGNLKLIASIYGKLGEYDKAVAYLQKVLDVEIKLSGPTHQEVGNLYKALGGTYAVLGEFDKAMDFYERARRIHTFYNDELSVTTHMSYFELGKIYRLAGDYKNARKHLHKALEIRQKMYGKYHGHIVWALLAIAETSYLQQQYADALGEIQHSLEILFPDFESQDGYVNPPIETVSHFRPAVLDALILKGKILQGMALQTRQSLWGPSGTAIKNFEAALECNDDALQLAAISLGGILTINAKLHLQTTLTEVVGQAIYSAQQLYDITGSRSYLERAFEFAERGKSALLRLNLQELKAKSFSGIDDKILRKEKELTQQIAALEITIAREKQHKERNKGKIVDLEAEYHQLKSQHEFLLADLEQNYPRYYELKYQESIPRIREIQGAFGENTALLNYFVGDSLIYLFVVTNDNLELVPLPKGEKFDSLVETYTSSIRRIVDARTYIESASRLYNLLIQPVQTTLARYKKLVIIPDGLLYYVPFEALLTSIPTASNEIDFSRPDYFLLHHEISYQYSAALHQRSQNGRTTSQAQNQMLALAPVFSADSHNAHIIAGNESAFDGLDAVGKSAFLTSDGRNFRELQYSETETRAIVSLFNGQGSIGYFHRQATEENFKANAGKFRCLHISTHGFVNERYPNLSGLAFSQPLDTASGEDGILYAGEIYTLKLNADLVVLSSCESGIGKLARGEGMFSLTRGFLYAGARNVMVSLWKVYDQHTSELMFEFYRGVTDGESYSTALQKAKLRMLQSTETSLPVSWAGFVLVGE
ncbi:MAG: CHAT domain-containing protein, partial [Anaerolineales bacterium]